MNIQKLMQEKGVNKSELARRMNLPAQSMISIMRNPTEATMHKIAAALGVETWQLLAPDNIRARDAEWQGLTCPNCGAPIRVVVTRKEE